jgi:predicted TIM-barrel fold metal-dependent hydrolase
MRQVTDRIVIDADGHVVEPPTLWTEYVEARYHARAPRTALDENGHPCQVVDGRIIMRHVGAECIVWASDYPHPDAHFPGAVSKTLAAMADVSPSARHKIFATNPARFYGLGTPVRRR